MDRFPDGQRKLFSVDATTPPEGDLPNGEPAQPARPFRDPYADYNRRREEIIATRDEDLGGEQTGFKQGISGIEEVPGTQEERQAAKKRGTHPTARGFSGPLRGDSEADTGSPHYHREPEQLSDMEKETGIQGLNKARNDLASGNWRNLPDPEDQ